MKKIILLAVIAMGVSLAQAQDTTVTTTTTTATTTTKKNFVVRLGSSNNTKTASFGFDLGVGFGWNRFIDNGTIGTSSSNANLTLEKGPEFILSLIHGYVDLANNHRLRASTSLGLTYNTYHFEKPISIQKGQDVLTIVSDSRHYNKNLLRSTYLTMPIKLSFRPADNADFVIAAGIEGGLLISGKTKQITTEDGNKKERGSFNLNPTRCGLFLGLGYRDFGLYAKYYMSDVFAKGQGPSGLKTVSIGICAGLF